MGKLGKLWNRAIALATAFTLAMGSLVIPSQTTVFAAESEPLVLGDPVFNADLVSYRLSNLTVDISADTTVKNVAINVNTGWLEPQGINAYGEVKKYTDEVKINNTTVVSTTYILSFNVPLTGAKVQELLRNVLFTTQNGQSQTVNVKLNNYNVNLPDNANVTALVDPDGYTHYYMFVPDNTNISWVNAYNAAKKFSMMGMKGYLATITREAEDKVIDHVSDLPGWAGGVRKQAFLGDKDHIYVNGNNDGNNNDRIWFDNDQNGQASDYNNIRKYYWAAGPEGVNRVQFGLPSQGYTHWRNTEPNNDFSGGYGNRSRDTEEGCLQVHYNLHDKGDQGWNDLPNRTGDENKIDGYFVEFGGYPVVNGKSTDPGYDGETNRVVDEKVIVVDPKVTRINLTGAVVGTNKDSAVKVVLTDKNGKTFPAVLDNNKNYKIPSIPAGEYTVTVTDAEGNDLGATPATVRVAGNNGGSQKQNLTVDKKSESITGKVTGSAADEVKTVVLTPANGSQPYTATVNPDGTYSIPNVVLGDYAVTTKDAAGKDVPNQTDKVTVVAGKTNGYDITVNELTVPVTGKVTGPAADQVGKVELTDGTNTYPGTVSKDDNGNPVYTVNDVPAGDYTIVVTDKDGEPLKAEPETVTVPERPTTPVKQDIAVDTIYHGPELVDIAGTVVGTNAAAVTTVVLTADDGTAYTADVNKNNAYKIADVPEGTYAVTTKDSAGEDVPNQTPSITVTPSQTEGYDVTVNELVVPVTGKVTGSAADDVAQVELTNGTDTYPGTIGTDENGNKTYNVPDVPAGEYTIVTKDGNGDLLKTEPEKVTVPKNPTNPVTQDIAVEAIYRGPEKVNISGAVVGTNAGEVATVVLTPADGSEPFVAPVDANGGYSVTEIPVGDYAVTTKDADGAEVPNQTPNLIVETGKTDGYNVQVDKTVVPVTGQITGPEAGNAEKIELTDGTNTYPGTITTDNNGNKTYNVPDVPAGGYAIVVTDKDGNPLKTEPEKVTVPERPTTPVTQDISVDKITPDPVLVPVSGKVVGTNAGEVATVVLTPADGSQPYTADVAKNNTYRIPNVPEGTYTVTTKDVNGEDVPNQTPSITVVPDKTAGYDITVDKVTPDPEKVDVKGDVTGTKADDADKVVLTPVDGGTPIEADVNDDGSFEIADVPEGTYEVTVKDKDGKDVTPSTPSKFDVTPNGPELDIVAGDPVTTVTGDITGPKADDVEKVELVDGDGNRYPADITTDPTTGEKSYEVPDVPAGDYTVEVTDKDGNPLKPEPEKITVDPSKPVDKDITVDKVTPDPEKVDVKGDVTGTKADDADKVVLTPVDGGTPIEADVNDDGSFEIADVPEGTYEVTVKDKDGKDVTPSTPSKFDVTPNGPELDIVAGDPVTTVTGDITGPKADDVDKVELVDGDGNRYPADITTDPTTGEKSYEVPDVPAGDYTVEVTDKDGNPLKSEPEKITVDPTKPAEKDITVDDVTPNPEKVDMSGKVVGDNKDAAKYIVLVDENGNEYPTKAFKDNTYAIKNVPEGTYAVKTYDAKGGNEVLNQTETLKVVKSQTTGYDITVNKPTTEVTGKVTGTEADTVTKIELVSKDDPSKKYEAPVKDKSFAIPDVTVGEYDVVIPGVAKDVVITPSTIKVEDVAGKTYDIKVDDPAKLNGGNGNKTPEKQPVKTVTEEEKTILNANTDDDEVEGSNFYQLRLRAYGLDKAIKLKWIKQSGADGYIIYGAACGNKYKKIKTIKNGKTTTWTQKKRKKATYYKYMIVAYKNVNGQKQVIAQSISAHSTTKGGKRGNPTKVLVNKTKVTLKVGKTYQLKGSYKCDKKVNEHIAIIRYESTNKDVATVTKKGGKIKAVGKGTCTIYVHAQNGFWKKVKVTVK